MTPFFGIFGSKSGFDTVKDCFEDKTNEIHALETGLSADPEMLWRNKDWGRFNLISTSDSHSFWPWRLGREATVFNLKELSYENVLKAIRTGEDQITITFPYDAQMVTDVKTLEGRRWPIGRCHRAFFRNAESTTPRRSRIDGNHLQFGRESRLRPWHQASPRRFEGHVRCQCVGGIS